MTLSSLVVSRDWQEVSVLQCILGGMHIDVEVESEPERAQAKLAKSKIDALIVDCDLKGTAAFLRGLQDQCLSLTSVPLVILSGSSRQQNLAAMGASFAFQKPVSVEAAVHTLSAARNMILEGRLRYHRQALNIPASLSWGSRRRIAAHLMNLSQGGVGIRMPQCLELAGAVQVCFRLPGIVGAVKARGKVVWSDQRGHVGIRFLQKSPRLQRDLQLWLEQQYFRH